VGDANSDSHENNIIDYNPMLNGFPSP